METTTSIVPIVANAAVAVSANITSLITKVRANGVIKHTQLELLKDQTAKVLADARAYHAGDIVITNLEQLARTQNHIDNLEREGRLHGSSLSMAMDQLMDLNDILRRNLKTYENRDAR